MPPRHVVLAIAVAVVWGANFVAIAKGLDAVSPLLFLTVRFALVALPLVLFVPRPKENFHLVVGIGVMSSALQFALIYIALDAGMPAGLASLVIQIQVAFTIGFAAVALHERPSRRAVAGCLVAIAGIGVIAVGRGGHVPLGALALTIAGAAAWAVGNVLTRKAQVRNQLSLLVWSSLVALPILFPASLLLEGPGAYPDALDAVDGTAIGALAFVVLASTCFGFGAWNWLIATYPVAVVAPYALLIPVFGVASAALFLDERPTGTELLGGVIVLAGLALANGLIRGRRRAAVPAAPPS